MPHNFALIGASGYVAPRHLKAIQATGGQLLAALDPHDAAGGLDAYFPQAAFFTEFERFDRHLEKLKRNGQHIDYLSVCSPNYLHDAHARYGLRAGADVICEKPLVLNPWNLEALLELEAETGRKVWNLLQLRHHPRVVELKNQVQQQANNPIFDVDLTYITPRGQWYHASWKGDPAKSGGIVTNIGIHLFDMLLWVFGKVQHAEIHLHTHGRATGFLQLERARVRWFLSIEAETLPPHLPRNQAHRSLQFNGQAWDFSEGFTDLHTESYRNVIAGQGWSIADAAPGIELTHRLRQIIPNMNRETAHPLAHLAALPHPFEGRIGSTNRVATVPELMRLFQQSGMFHFDSTSVDGTSIGVLNWSKLDLYFSQYGLSFSDDTQKEQLLINTDILSTDLKATVAGLLVFGTHPQRYLHDASISFAHFAGTTIGDHLLDKKVIEGTLDYQIDTCVSAIRDNIRHPSIINGTRREDLRFEYPEKVFRELIVNACLHRNYAISGSRIRVFLFDDRLEVRSPGRLPNTVTVEKMRAGVSYSINPVLLKFMENLRYIDKLGRGIPMVNQIAIHNNKQLLLEESGEEFIVTLYL